MEFPDLGKHCGNSVCKQLDFLPMKCDACSLIFCKDHIQYSTHNCAESYKKDKQVPVCPLCSKPIPLKPGEVADVKVGNHIDADCQSDPAKERRKVYTNRCSKKGCKVKEMVRVTCDRCKNNYCLKHRHENDHDCAGSRSNSPASVRARAANAAAGRSHQSSPANRSPTSTNSPQRSFLNTIGLDLARDRQSRNATQAQVPVGSFQAGLSEQEALQRALQLSASEAQPKANDSSQKTKEQQEADDLALAQAIAESEREARNTNRGNTSSEQKSSCVIN